MSSFEELNDKAREIRKHIIEMISEAKSGHPGGSLSAVEIVTALYFNIMNIKPDQPKWEDRDRFILSKGHGAPVLYAALAEKGYFPADELLMLRKTGAMLQGHPDMKGTPGVDMSTGSLGQGLSAANGMAMAGKLDRKGYRVYVLIGDGELEEGQVWEGAMASAHYKLDNLTAFIDHNRLQIDGPVEKVMNPNPIDEKFRAFGWNVITIDGHDFGKIIEAVSSARLTRGKPTAIIAETVKGRGVSFMENEAAWHGTAPDKEQRDRALLEIGGGR